MSTGSNWFKSLGSRSRQSFNPKAPSSDHFDSINEIHPRLRGRYYQQYQCGIANMPSRDLHLRPPDMSWWEPQTDLLLDALRVHMMTKSPDEPTTRDYDPHIKYLIEKIDGLLEKIDILERGQGQLQETVADLEHRLASSSEKITQQWVEREGEFRAEIKRLELIIAETSRDGMETVALARANSVIGRTTKDSEKWVKKFQRLSGLSGKSGHDENEVTSTSPQAAKQRLDIGPSAASRTYRPATILDPFRSSPNPDSNFIMSEAIRRGEGDNVLRNILRRSDKVTANVIKHLPTVQTPRDLLGTKSREQVSVEKPQEETTNVSPNHGIFCALDSSPSSESDVPASSGTPAASICRRTATKKPSSRVQNDTNVEAAEHVLGGAASAQPLQTAQKASGETTTLGRPVRAETFPQHHRGFSFAPGDDTLPLEGGFFGYIHHGVSGSDASTPPRGSEGSRARYDHGSVDISAHGAATTQASAEHLLAAAANVGHDWDGRNGHDAGEGRAGLLGIGRADSGSSNITVIMVGDAGSNAVSSPNQPGSPPGSAVATKETEPPGDTTTMSQAPTGLTHLGMSSLPRHLPRTSQDHSPSLTASDAGIPVRQNSAQTELGLRGGSPRTTSPTPDEAHGNGGAQTSSYNGNASRFSNMQIAAAQAVFKDREKEA